MQEANCHSGDAHMARTEGSLSGQKPAIKQGPEALCPTVLKESSPANNHRNWEPDPSPVEPSSETTVPDDADSSLCGTVDPRVW